jgi:tRNA modification GTPase
LRDAFEMLSNAVGESHAGLDVRSEYLRQASHSLGRITGRVDVENLLDVIFSEFCVGK